MATYSIDTEQSFMCTYVVEADSPEEAWANLMTDHNAEAVYQAPGDIIGTYETSDIVEDPA